MLNEEVKKIAAENYISDVGFSDLSITESDFERGITLVVKLSDAIMDEIKDKPTYSYYNHYKSVNRLIDDVSLKICLFLESKGYAAYTVSSSQSIPPREEYKGVFPHKTAATLSGLGFIGKSGLFIHEKFGARIRLGTILTNAPFETGTPVVESKCGSCDVCKNACPASAINGVLWQQGTERNKIYDPLACSEYMKNYFSLIGRGDVCGICAALCPYYKKNKN